MNIEEQIKHDLALRTNLKLVSCEPFSMRGCVIAYKKETHFSIVYTGGNFLLSCDSDDYSTLFYKLEDAIKEAYFMWGE